MELRKDQKKLFLTPLKPTKQAKKN